MLPTPSYAAEDPPAAPAPKPPVPRPQGSPISHEPPPCQEAEPLSPEELEQQRVAVQWVREHCEAQSYPVSECEVTCRPRLDRAECEAECQSYQAFSECPMVECPEGTKPEWKGWFYRAECPGQQRAALVEPPCP